MAEKISLEELQKRYKVTPMHHTESQLDGLEASLRAHKQARQQQQSQHQAPADPRAYRANQQVARPRAPQPTPELHIKGRKEKEPNRKRKVLLRTAAGIAIASSVMGAAYAGNAFDAKNQLNAFMSHLNDGSKPSESGFKVSAAELKGESSLGLDQCMGQKAVFSVFVVDGYLPLVPVMSSDKNATPANVPKYLTVKTIDENKNLSDLQKKQLKPFKTDSGYPESTLNGMPLAMTICEADGAKPITEQNGKVTLIDRTQLQVRFEDPYGMTKNDTDKVNIMVGFQQTGAHNVALEPNHAQYGTLPLSNLLMQPTVAPNIDAAYNKSLDTLQKAMDTAQQRQVLIAAMEAGAIKQIDANGNTLRDHIDEVLLKRLGGDPANPPAFQGNYTAEMDVQKDPKTKQGFTIDQLVGLDTKQEFHITNLKIQDGSIDLSKITPLPTPSASATPAPTTTP